MSLDAFESAEVISLAQRVTAEMLRNTNRGTGGAVIPIPTLREGTAADAAASGAEVLVTIDGDDDPVPVTNGTGLTIHDGDRVLVTWVPPHGVYATALLSGASEGAWTPALSGTGANATGASSFGRYTVVDRRVRAWGKYVLGAGGSWGTGGATIGGLPFPVRSYTDGGAVTVQGDAYYLRTTGALLGGRWICGEGASGGQLWFNYALSTPAGVLLSALTATIPVAQAAGDQVYFDLTYDAD